MARKTPAPRRLTEGYIRGLSCNGSPDFVRDTAARGFLVDVNKRSKTYKLQADLWVGTRGRRRQVKTVRHTPGSIEELPLDEALAGAMTYLGQIKQWVDPWGATPGRIWSGG